MHKKFEINRTKIKGGCQSGRKMVTHNSKSDLPLHIRYFDETPNLDLVFCMKKNSWDYLVENPMFSIAASQLLTDIANPQKG